MKNEVFKVVMEDTFRRVKELSDAKAAEYAQGDSNILTAIEQAGGLLNVIPERALLGMVTKHFVSLANMSKAATEASHSIEMWDEKILDVMSYMLLLRAKIINRVKYLDAEDLERILEDK